MKLVSALACVLLAGAAGATVVNGDFQAGNSGFTSAYSYRSSGGPPGGMYDEGTYSVVSFDTLHPLWSDFYDHTYGDERGLYMIVNGTTQGMGPAWSQSVVLAPNTVYTLSGWFANLYPESPSAIEFRVNGGTVMPTFAAPNAVGQWVQHSVSFNSGMGGSTLLEIWDTDQVHTGNDYAVDDICITPAPGAALLGLGGLAAGRRRR